MKYVGTKIRWKSLIVEFLREENIFYGQNGKNQIWYHETRYTIICVKPLYAAYSRYLERVMLLAGSERAQSNVTYESCYIIVYYIMRYVSLEQKLCVRSFRDKYDAGREKVQGKIADERNKK